MDSITTASLLFFPVYTSIDSTVRTLFDAGDSIHQGESDNDSGHEGDSEWSGVSWEEEEEYEGEEGHEYESRQKIFETEDRYETEDQYEIEPPSYVCYTPIHTPPSSETESEDSAFEEET